MKMRLREEVRLTSVFPVTVHPHSTKFSCLNLDFLSYLLEMSRTIQNYGSSIFIPCTCSCRETFIFCMGERSAAQTKQHLLCYCCYSICYALRLYSLTFPTQCHQLLPTQFQTLMIRVKSCVSGINKRTFPSSTFLEGLFLSPFNLLSFVVTKENCGMYYAFKLQRHQVKYI